MKKSQKAINLYLELLEIQEELRSPNIKYLYERQEELLEKIYDLNKGPQIVFDSTVNDKEIEVEVLEQKGHYVFNKPLRLSVKKAV